MSHVAEAIGVVERKQTETSNRWSLNPALPLVRSVTPGTSFNFPKPRSTTVNMVLNLLQLDFSLRLYLINGKYLIKTQSLRQDLVINLKHPGTWKQ